ncbi:CHAT domain-containing protein [Paucibacter oligotrophus]|uniref:CHAT domain-containing protein n=1 Tax=Roseateles oligotrophus TaxID=1769250 RepID=A0A840LAL4_9BURK|nr:CHAT domain-containing protein [Roseateles oligotrophus]MBB4845186.1 CHAT domain-containing protein [Roseateles oligotrophus]
MSPRSTLTPWRFARPLLSALLFGALCRGELALAAVQVSMPSLCAEALSLPAEKLDLHLIEQEFVEVDAQGEVSLDLACRAWAASHRAKESAPEKPLVWQALSAQVLLAAQRREEAMVLAASSYEAAMKLGAAGRLAARRAATAMGQAFLQVREHEGTHLWMQRAVDANDPNQALDQDGALALVNRATAELMVGRFQDGERRLLEVLNLMGELGHSPAQLQAFAYPKAVALNQLLYAQSATAQWAAALATSEQLLLHRWQFLPADRTGLALALGNRGSILVKLGRFDEAQHLLEAALDESQGGGSSDAMASGAAEQMRSNLAQLLLARGQPQLALTQVQRAVARTQGGAQLNALRQQAEAQIALGDLHAAVSTLRVALKIVQTQPPLGEAWLRLQVLLAYAKTQLILGDLSEAAVWLDAADKEASAVPSNHHELGERWVLRASLLEQQGLRAEALQAIDQAGLVYAQQFPAQHPQRLGLLIRACGLGRACEALPESLASAQTPPSLTAAAALVLARYSLSKENGQAAQKYAEQALTAAHAAAQSLLQWQALYEFGRSQAALSRPTAAIFFGKLAVDQLQQARHNLSNLGVAADAQFLADKLQVYRQLASWLFDAGRLAEGLEILHLLKRQELDDYNERAQALLGAAPSLTEQEQSWREQLASATRLGEKNAAEILRLSRLQAASRINAAELARLAALQAEQADQAPKAAAMLGLQLTQIGQEGAEQRLKPLAQGGIWPADSRLTLPSDARTLHVYLMVEPNQVRAILVGRQGRKSLQVPIKVAELTRQIAELLDAVRQGRDERPHAQALHRVLGPLLDAPARTWGIRQLVLSLDGPLRYLPIGLLHDGQAFLIDRYTLAVATPADGALRRSAKALQADSAPLRVQAWGVTQALEGLPALPGVGEELCGIVKGPAQGLPVSLCDGVLSGRAAANAFFTETSWRSAAARSGDGGVVHIGTHFVLRPGNVARSWLLLGDGARLKLEQLRGWPLGSPRLLTLSACETALPSGSGSDGRELDGLTSTLLSSGAQQVVASLWRVEDRSTAGLMRQFYTALKQQPENAAAALQVAQRAALRAGAPASVWAAFTLSVPTAR